MEQQTAVDWFSEKVFDLFNEFQRGHISIVDFRLKMITIEEQAKAMEKENMHKCASFWRGKENEIEKPIFDEYYNETYGNYQKLQ